MAPNALPDILVLCQLFHYNPQTGELLCAVRKNDIVGRTRDKDRARKWNEQTFMRPVGSISDKGYLRIGIARVNYPVHRIVWKMHYGIEPAFQIDHINGNKLDNRIENLRDVPACFNSRNKVVKPNATTGVRGVHKRENGRFLAVAKIKGKIIRIGTFDTIEGAQSARLQFDTRHGFSSRHLGG